MDMKAINRVVFAALGFLCLAFAACTKVETDSYSDYAWTGEYPIKTQNGTTGEMEDFALYRTSGHQSLLEYSGTITGDKMTLQALNCDSVAATYELSRISLLE